MELFYFGSICNQDIFDARVEKSRKKPSASAQNFESALIKGFAENPEINLYIVSAESVAMFPDGDALFLKKRTDKVSSGVDAHILPALNLPIFKQKGHTHGAASQLKKWLSEHSGTKDKCVLVYGIYPAVVKKLQKVCAKYSCPIFAVITDIPSTMFTYTKSKSILKRLFGGRYRASAVAVQGGFDGYVYLTEAMSEAVAPGKPYTVMETIADTGIFDSVDKTEKSEPPALMYAGALYAKYGVDLIVDAFEHVKTNSELWLFGSGDYESTVQAKAESSEKDGKNKIRFFGRVPRQEVLLREKQAALLLNIRNSDDEYTKYSFPSKMVEYMLSGTPMLTTRVDGIPDEYYRYVYTADERTAEGIAGEIDRILCDTAALKEKGEAASHFVKTQKNSTVQAKKVYDFLKAHI